MAAVVNCWVYGLSWERILFPRIKSKAMMLMIVLRDAGTGEGHCRETRNSRRRFFGDLCKAIRFERARPENAASRHHIQN